MRHLERHWTGHPTALRRAVELARQRGQLVDERWLTSREVVVRLRPALPPAPRRRAGRWWAVGLATAGSLAIGVGWAVWWVLSWVAVHAVAIGKGALGVAAVVAGVWWLLGRLGACPGVHCPGCACHGAR